jgi:hypothetical protein
MLLLRTSFSVLEGEHSSVFRHLKISCLRLKGQGQLSIVKNKNFSNILIMLDCGIVL